MRFAVIERIADFDEMFRINFDIAYILMQVLVVYLDGNTGIYMILEMVIAD